MASAVFKTVARPHERSRVGSTPMHSRQQARCQVSGFSGEEPSERVIAEFGGGGQPVRLAGGQGETFRAGDVVLKRSGLEAEAEWTATLFDRIAGPGFRVPRPRRSHDGRFVVHGWCAWEYVAAEHAGPNGGRWAETIAVCRAFHAALANEPRPAFLDSRSDAWAEADRLTFGEQIESPLAPVAEAIGRLRRLLRPVAAPSQLVHGDFTANVLFAEGEQPCVIDFSPYWRPAPFALGVVVADAIAWAAADPSVANLCADVPAFGQWLARGALRRLWELDQHARRGRAVPEAAIRAYAPVVALAERLAG